jgi:hypothetical protein
VSLTLDLRLSTLKCQMPSFICAGWQSLAERPELLIKAWNQCGLLRAWEKDFQNQANRTFSRGNLFLTGRRWMSQMSHLSHLSMSWRPTMGEPGRTFAMSVPWRSPQSLRGRPGGDQRSKDHQLGSPRRGAELLAARTRSLPRGKLQRRPQRATLERS